MNLLCSSPIHRSQCMRLALASALATAVFVVGIASAYAAGPARYPRKPWGSDSAASSCVVCHSLESGGTFRVAPNLYGIYGAEKARDREWYAYSPALRAKGGTWTEDDLHAFLEDASKFTPGSTKSIRLRDAEERQEIIDFLKTLQ